MTAEETVEMFENAGFIKINPEVHPLIPYIFNFDIPNLSDDEDEGPREDIFEKPHVGYDREYDSFFFSPGENCQIFFPASTAQEAIDFGKRISAVRTYNEL